LHTIDGRVFLIQPAPGVNRLEALNKLTNTYIQAYNVSRTLRANLEELQAEFRNLVALVVFQAYTVQQVLQIAKVGHRLPAGITRFIIPGRVLRINAELSYLKSDKSLREKNEWLHQLLVDKQVKSKIRYYKEPVYLLDE
jgi:hypothetical protein